MEIDTTAKNSHMIALTRSDPAGSGVTCPSPPAPTVAFATGGASRKVLDGLDRCDCFAFKNVIDEICGLAWDELDSDEVMGVAKAYYYFSIQFRENLEIARALHPDDQKLAELWGGECNTDNLSPWPGVAAPGERMNHDEFMRRLVCFHPADRDGKLIDAGLVYLEKTRQIDLGARASSIASYEDGGLSRVFSSMLRAPHWYGQGQRAFRFFLEEHIRFDSDDGARHAELSRHLASDDRVLPLWTAFRDLLVTAVPKLAPMPRSLRTPGDFN